MADAPATGTGGKSTFGFLSKKLGPMPIGLWLLAAIAVYWYMSKGSGGGLFGSGSGSTAASSGAAANQVDPNSPTGQTYGEELAAYGQQIADQSSGSGSGSTVAGKYADNNSWGIAAINYLVARSVDPTQANQAIQQYLGGQTLTTQQQADVNLAIQGIGPPPDLPGPSATNPGQVVTPPTSGGGGTPTPPAGVNRYPAPSGLHVIGTTSTTASVQWKALSPAPQSYTVATWQMNGKRVGYATVQADAQGGDVSYTVTGLHAKYQYKIQVWANGGKVAPPGASVVATTK